VPVALLGLTAAAGPAGAGAGPAAALSDSEIAEAGTITDTDLTGGWFSAPNDDSSTKARLKLAKKTKGCTDYVAFTKSFATTTDAESPEYETTSQQLSNHSYVYKTGAAAKKAYSSASAKGMAKCLQALFTKQFEAQLKADPAFGAQVETYRVGITDIPEATNAKGDQSVGYGGGIEVKSPDGSTDQVLVSTFVVRVGRAILTYSYTFAPQTDPAALDTALDNSLGRIQAALAAG
jgi:hypothetical protein